MRSLALPRSFRPLQLLAPLAFAALATAQGGVPLVPVRDARLLGQDTVAFDDFGLSLALSGTTAIVGSLLADTAGGIDAGAAYVFVRTPGGWVQQQKLVASDGAASDGFGVSVAVDGDRAAVGAFLASVGGVGMIGAVYVFERNGSTWTETAKLVGLGADIGEGMGWSLALQGDTLVAGAADDHHSGGQITGGAAYVFVHGALGWTQQQRVAPIGGEAFDYFGHAVALDGDRLAVGAYSDNHSFGANGGSVSVFERSGGIWTQVQKIVPQDNGSNDQFGFQLDLQGDELVVGAVGDTIGPEFAAGSAYVFRHGLGGFTQAQKIDAPTPAQYEAFGSAIALDGDTLLIGSSSGSNAVATYSGTAHVFQRSSGGFVLDFDLFSTVIEQGADFGFSAALDGPIALVGAPGDDTPVAGQNVGSVYAYVFEPAVGTYCTAKVNSLGCTPSIGWSGLPSLSSAAPFLITADHVLDHKNGLLFYGYASNSAPFQGGTLCVAAPTRRAGLQNSGGSAGSCTGSFAFDFNAWLQAGADPELALGSEVFAQYWSRDPQSPIPTSLTDALHAHVLP